MLGRNKFRENGETFFARFAAQSRRQVGRWQNWMKEWRKEKKKKTKKKKKRMKVEKVRTYRLWQEFRGQVMPWIAMKRSISQLV